jgi:ABC-type amino acid transport substrate-binding protein
MMSVKKGSNMQANVAFVLALIALVFSLLLFFQKPNSSKNISSNKIPGLLERIEETGKIHAGYGIYPPYTMEDPNSKKVSGFSIDLINQIAKELNCEVEWHRINWNTMSADLKRGEFDVIADPIFQTIPRAREFSFTEPYAYFADGIAVVKKDENRFKEFKDLNAKGIKIVVGQGWASEVFVKVNLTEPEIKSVQTSSDLLQVFNEVITGRADVAISDGADAERFVKEHPAEVKALWLDNPPAAMPAGFALRPSDDEGAEFLTICLRNLKSTGVIEGLAQKYKIDTIRK